MRVSAGTFQKTPIIKKPDYTEANRMNETAKGLSAAVNVLDDLVQKNQQLKASADMAQVQKEMSSWIDDEYNKGNYAGLPDRFNQELDKRISSLRGQGGYYTETIDNHKDILKAQLYDKVSNTVVNGMMIENKENAQKLIDGTLSYIRENRSELENKTAELETTLKQKYYMSPADRSKTIEEMKQQLALTVIDEDLRSDPAVAVKDIRNGRYNGYLNAIQQNTYLSKAEKLSQQKSSIDTYAMLYSQFKNDDGSFNYTDAVQFLRKPENQEKLGLTGDSANKVADMLYSQFNQDNEMREKNRSVAATTELDNAWDLFFNGNSAEAINLIANSENIKGETKNAMIERMKNNTAQTGLETQNLMQQIAKREINSDEEILDLLAQNKISYETANRGRELLKNRDAKAHALLDNGIEQINKVFGTGLMGKLTPLEAAQKQKAIGTLTDLYNEMIKSGATYQDMQKVFTPENIEKVRQQNAVEMKDAINSKIETIKYQKNSANTTAVEELQNIPNQIRLRRLAQRKAGESIDDYLKRTEK
ncbi:MAG: hypothetical protein MJ250_02845 [Alphaproteobacteria bacterium]|nr:hypothetical protein [Alphaproteobacteria bacterium]